MLEVFECLSYVWLPDMKADALLNCSISKRLKIILIVQTEVTEEYLKNRILVSLYLY